MVLAENVLAQVPREHAEIVAATIRTVFARPDADHVRSQLDVIAGMLGRRFPRVGTMLRDASDEVTAFEDVTSQQNPAQRPLAAQ